MPRHCLWNVVTKSDVQIWDSKLPAEWHLTTTYRLSSISFKMDRETTRAHLSSPSLSDTPLFLTSFKCSLLTLRLGIPLENCGAFPPSVTSQPSLKHLVHHSYTFTTCKIKQAIWPFYKDHNTFMSHLDSTDPWVPHRPLRPWQTLQQRREEQHLSLLSNSIQQNYTSLARRE